MIAKDDPIARQVLGLIPINSLDQSQQDQVLAAGEVLEFKRRRVVFESGTRDPYTFYLLGGQLELEPDDAAPMRMDGNDPNALRALAQLQPRRYTARTMTPVQVFRIERAALDRIMTEEAVADHAGAVEVTEIEEEEDGGDWMTRLLNSELFTRLPHDNIQRFFAELEPLEVAKGGVVVEQGTPGDFLYIVAEGLGEVVRRVPGSGQEIQLGSLKEGDTFGEESLISNTPRNASVRMADGGVVMRLPKRSFEELVRNPTLKAVTYSDACKLVEGGGVWVDVRFKDEHEAHAIEGSVNAPLNALRIEARKLERSRPCVVYCDTGARSSTGAFLLARLGFEACYLAGGLDRSPLAQGGATIDDAFEIVSEEPEAEEPEQSEPAEQADESDGAWTANKIKDYAAKARAERRAKAATTKARTEPESKTARRSARKADRADEAPDRSTKGTSGESAEKTGGETPERTAKKTGRKTPQRAARKTADKTTPNVADEAASETAPERAGKTPAGDPAPAAVEPDPELARAAGQAAAQAAQAAQEQARLRAQLEALTAERDKSAQLLERAAGAGRELKRRYDELQASAHAERAQREELERDLATLKAGAERQLGLERARLEGELEKASQKLAELQQAQASAAADSERTRSESDRVRDERERLRAELEARASEAEERLKESAARIEALEASLAQYETALQEARRHAEEAVAAERARSEQAESEVARLGVELESLSASAREAHESAKEAQESKEARESALESAVAKAKAAAEAERAAILAERDAVAAERRGLEERADAVRAEHQRLEQELAEARGALVSEASGLRSRGEALDRREAELAKLRESIEAELETRHKALTEGEAALGEEKLAWREEVERAIGAERERLQADLAQHKKELEQLANQAIASQTEEARAQYEEKLADMRAEAQARVQAGAQKADAVRAEYEARLAATREDVDAQMADLHEKYTAVIDATRRELEIQRAEQEALLADQSRQLELENARLREALAAGLAVEVPAPRPSPYRAPGSEGADTGLDLEIDMSEEVPAPEPTPYRAPGPEGADTGLDLEIDMSEFDAAEPEPAPAPEPEPMPVIELDASRELPVKAAPDAIPTIDPGAMADPENDDRARVLSPGQLADIRRKMQEKIAASKKRSA